MHFAVRAAGAAGTVSCGTPGLGTRPDCPLNPAVFYAQPDRGIYRGMLYAYSAPRGGRGSYVGFSSIAEAYPLNPSVPPTHRDGTMGTLTLSSAAHDETLLRTREEGHPPQSARQVPRPVARGSLQLVCKAAAYLARRRPIAGALRGGSVSLARSRSRRASFEVPCTVVIVCG
ncbi:hypothetical protein RR46_01294 [Papilio xuthus]|uniref:Uncharacterized protein n=1 Tax=Papilio xuthus TaxID=66420 RepID=A0A0N1PGA3_PAPXU|nr:hypothetical protein RR46_01294 [Papilio xuthus]